jgi:hypothetical protein
MTEMKKSSRTRATMLAGVVAIALFALGSLWGADEPPAKKPVFTDPIVGQWNCPIPPAGGAPGFTVIKNIHVGGTESEIDNAVPPSQESPTVGTWTKTRHLAYTQNAYQMSWDASGNFIGTWNYTGSMTVRSTFNTLNIQGLATLFDANGNVLTSFPFAASCTRL